MKICFDEKELTKLAEKYRNEYQSNVPFPHIVIDNFMPEAILSEALAQFPEPKDMEFYIYDNPLEKKLAFDQISRLPERIGEILYSMNSNVFLKFLEELTGIDGLIPDPYYRGGGIHQIVPQGKLDIHIDFNIHQKLKLDRRLNVLIYLNKNWKEEYGGYFELWDGKKENGKHILNECKKKVLPIFNRFVCFNTNEVSYHGHPEPLGCPEGWTRKSLATYYYSNGRPKEETVPAHSTTFIARPSDPDDESLKQLREKRNQGRLQSNIKSNLTS